MKPNRRQFKLRHFFAASVLLHSLTMLSIAISHLFAEKPALKQTVQFEIVEPPLLSSEQNKKSLVSKKHVEPAQNQVVDQNEQALNDERPDDARFLSRHNQVVKKQTVAQNRGDFQNKQSKEQQGKQGQESKPNQGFDLKPSFDIAKAIQDRTARETAFEKAAMDGTLAIDQKQKMQAMQKLNEGGVVANKGGEVSQTLDYIKDLDSGLETLLSTKEFVYYSYFNRIRTQLNQYWTDKVRQKMSDMYKRGRSIASTDDKITKCLITLDTAGKLIKVQIIGDSGVRELDEAAVEAFRSAAPFPNPPKGMMDDDGTIKIRWDFILEA